MRLKNICENKNQYFDRKKCFDMYAIDYKTHVKVVLNV